MHVCGVDASSHSICTTFPRRVLGAAEVTNTQPWIRNFEPETWDRPWGGLGHPKFIPLPPCFSQSFYDGVQVLNRKPETRCRDAARSSNHLPSISMNHHIMINPLPNTNRQPSIHDSFACIAHSDSPRFHKTGSIKNGQIMKCTTLHDLYRYY